MDYFDNRPSASTVTHPRDREILGIDRPRTRDEIEAEKAAKPRPDLLPPLALAMVLSQFCSTVFGRLALFLKSRDLAELGYASVRILDELCMRGVAKSRADAIMQAGEIMGVGLRKHGPCTWRIAGTEQADPQCHYASLVRHLLEYEDGVTQDPDSGRHPLLHAVCQISIMINLLDDPPEHPDDNDGRAMIGRPR